MNIQKYFLMSALLLVALLFVGASTGCVHVAHPNQINAFDGSAYDTLIATQAALTELRTKMTAYPQYKPQFNDLVAAYNLAQSAYKTYHIAGTANTPQTQAALQTQLTDVVSQLSKLLTATGVKLQ